MARRGRQDHQGARAFTLLEMFIVIGIIGLLAGLVIGGLSHGRRNARKSAIQLQIAGISQALESYAQTFNGYYPPSYPTGALATSTYAIFPTQAASGLIKDHPVTIGGQMLAQALVGWMPAAIGGTTGDGAGAPIPGDTNDFGFRNKGRGQNAVGTVYGPFVTPSNKNYDPTNHIFIDINGQPIYYYRRTPDTFNGALRTNVNQAFGTWNYATNGNLPPNNPLTFTAWFVSDDNPHPSHSDMVNGKLANAPEAPTPSPFLQLLGVQSGNNTLAAGDVIRQKNYLLVSSGEDQEFFTPPPTPLDDVVNDVR